MSGYSVPSREDDPIHTVRTISRIAQMIVELRDEYVRRPRPDTFPARAGTGLLSYQGTPIGPYSAVWWDTDNGVLRVHVDGVEGLS